jgi:hypothetical protein
LGLKTWQKVNLGVAMVIYNMHLHYNLRGCGTEAALAVRVNLFSISIGQKLSLLENKQVTEGTVQFVRIYGYNMYKAVVAKPFINI